MEQFVIDANKEIERKMYKTKLEEFRNCTDISQLIKDYKSNNMRFSVILDKELAVENKDNDYVEFLDSVINSMTDEIVSINKSVINGNVDDVLSRFSFHEKVNIIFYVRDNYYDFEFEPFEILSVDAYEVLKDSIINEANELLGKNNLTLEIYRKENYLPCDLATFIDDEELRIDICFAAELVNEEIFDIYNRDGEYLGKQRKAVCHSKNPGFYHKPVWIWIINDKNEVLVQKRAAVKKNHPNKWDMPSAGHVVAGESSIDGAIRETLEELGVETKESDYKFICEYIDDHSWEIAQVYLLKLNLESNNFKLQEEEVSEVKWLSYDEFKKLFYSDDFVRFNNDYRELVLDMLKDEFNK